MLSAALQWAAQMTLQLYGTYRSGKNKDKCLLRQVLDSLQLSLHQTVTKFWLFSAIVRLIYGHTVGVNLRWMGMQSNYGMAESIALTLAIEIKFCADTQATTGGKRQTTFTILKEEIGTNKRCIYQLDGMGVRVYNS